MKLTIICLLVCLHLSARIDAQKVTLDVTNASLEQVFKKIQEQTRFNFLFNEATLLKAKKITLNVKEEALQRVLEICFKEQPFVFEIIDNYILVKDKITAYPSSIPKDLINLQINVRGKIMDEKRDPIIGATVNIVGAKISAVTDKNGEFDILSANDKGSISVSNVGYETKVIAFKSGDYLQVYLKLKTSILDEQLVIAYGTTSQRLNTGSVSKVSSEVISRQPVGNPLAALQGQVPGLTVTSSSGIPGASIKVQIRGQNSLLNGSDPLFIIDGVPYAANNSNINNIQATALNNLGGNSTAAGGISPFNLINPADIASIEILKDADATSIYGSRGANGVILITTKKPQGGKTTLSGSVSTGVSRVTKLPKTLSTQTYVQMRKDAFANDGVVMNNTNAYDLLIWDTTKFTDWNKEFYGGTAKVIDGYTSLSGGNSNTRFNIGTGYRRETTVFPTNAADLRYSIRTSFKHESVDRKLSVEFVTNYIRNVNNLPISLSTTLPPNAPDLYDSLGKIYWGPAGAQFLNPYAGLKRTYNIASDNNNTNLILGYKIYKSLSAKISMGYNIMKSDEKSLTPIESQNPNSPTTLTGSSSFSKNDFKNLIVEPQIEYVNNNLLRGKVTLLLGATYQNNSSTTQYIDATGYTNDALLESLNAAPTISSVANTQSSYKYAAISARMNYNLNDKYIANLSARRDGSSRFGPNNQFASFGAVGLAWIFSNENFIKKNLPFMSYGKLRGSYGITGNDQIGDYRYLDTWSASSPYQGAISLSPDKLLNANYNWERNKKMEIALETGFFNDRLLTSIAYYKNRCDNQLVQYRLPSQTGFSSILANLPALIDNSGLELSISTSVVNNRRIKWTFFANATFPSNKLLSFPDLATSTYASIYEEGKSINSIRKYRSLGVNPLTGIYNFDDLNSDGSLDSKDIYTIGETDPTYFGGIGSNIEYGPLKLNVFFEGKKQIGTNYIYSIYTMNSSSPGTMYFQPIGSDQYWKNDKIETEIQKPTTTSSSAAYRAINTIKSSSASYSDASYIRLKNVMITYDITSILKKMPPGKVLNLYVQGQNLFVLTRYRYADPETQNLRGLSPLKTFVLGIQFNL